MTVTGTMTATAHVHAIVGPTGRGKSAAAEALAQRLDSPIVVADRLQCFIDLRVTTARTPRGQENGIARHYVAERRVADCPPPADLMACLVRVLEGKEQRSGRA
jgi:hypothetical protein